MIVHVKADMATKIKLEDWEQTMAIKKSIGWNNPQTNSDQQNQPLFYQNAQEHDGILKDFKYDPTTNTHQCTYYPLETSVADDEQINQVPKIPTW